MFAIYKKELRSYFTTPLGYIFCAVYLAVSGFALSIMTVHASSVDVSGFFSVMIFANIILVPILTMKSFAEERKMKTEQLLITSPVSIASMVVAKFFASLTIYIGALAVSCLNFVGLSNYGTVNVPKTFGCIIAMLLIGMCFVAVGIFVSSLTENTVTAAVGSMGVLALMALASVLNSRINVYGIRQILSWISVYSRYQYFTYGIFDVSAAVYYVSLTVVFLFLAVRVHDRRRWA